MSFITTSQHINVSSSSSFFVISNTYFVLCNSRNGGAIFSSLNIKHSIKYCHFYKCSAVSNDPQEGRGGAFLIDSGIANAKHCCSEGCVSKLGGCFHCWHVDTTIFEYIQTFNSINDEHGIWVHCDSKSIIKYINATNTHINKGNQYGSGLNTAISQKPIALKFFNFVSNYGNPAIFEFEGIKSLTIDYYCANVIDNKEQQSYIFFRLCDSSTIKLFSCFFINNEGSTIYKEYQTNENSEENAIYFENCSFSISKINQNNVFCALCAYNQIALNMIINSNTLLFCENQILSTCMQKIFQNKQIVIKYVHVLILVSN